MNYRYLWIAACAAAVFTTPLAAKPIAYANGTSVMLEYGGDTMQEAQVFYAPKYWYSYGGGALRLRSEDATLERDIVYLRGNLLAKRWNQPSAQGNFFIWGGLGNATGNDFSGSELTYNAGFQLDYETTRFYSAFRTDWNESRAFSHRTDTLQLGWAPYKHDYNTLATWIVLQARNNSNEIDQGTETALLLRFFKNNVWIEAGVNNDGKPQAMAMFNF
jgi:hypothetical protein